MDSHTDDPAAVLVRRWWDEVWGAGRLELIPELTTDPFRRHSESGTVDRTHAELAEDMQRYRRTLHDCTPVFESQMVRGDHVFTRLRTTGVNLETGDAIEVHWMQEHRIDDGRLAETWVLYTFTPGWDTHHPPPGSTYPSAGVG